jgi:predicted ATPase/DNA-binding SARP family transcriptional activator
VLRIHLFGGARFDRDGEPLRRPSRNALAVLAYLISHHDERVSRAKLAFTLWPDEAEAAAFARLRRALFTLNEALPSAAVPFVSAAKNDISWNRAADAWADVVAFRQLAVDPQHMKAAIDVYAGPLLPELDDPWLFEPRERLARLYDRLLETVIEQERSAGNRVAAQRYSDIRLVADPLREDVLRRTMELSIENADRAGALRIYRRFADRLRDEVGVGPDPETTALFQRIMTDGMTVEVRRRTNVPRSATSFVGRENDIVALAARFHGGARLLTITGPGGVGKSRLAKEAGLAIQDAFPGGVWLVEISDRMSGSRILEDIARALGLATTSAAHVRDAVEQYLRAQATLIVLDGCEHALGAASEIVERLLQETADTCILVTSRERMRLAAEVRHALSALRLPEQPVAGASDAMRFSAIDLFVKRARMIGGGLFDITDGNAETVRHVVMRTAGIPLAIELAVPWLRMVSIEQLAERLKDRFAVLIARDSGTPERHQTLDALVGWSYESLSDDMRAMFLALAVFPGSFTLDAAVAVGAPAGSDAAVAFERLAALVDKSLVQSAAGERRRFSLLDVVREFALRRQKPKQIAALRERLTHYIVGLAEAMDRDRRADLPERVWMKTLVDERHSIDAVLAWTLEGDGEGRAGAQLTTHLTRYFESEPFERGRRWFERALAALGDERSEWYAEAVIGREIFSRLERPTAERLAALEDAVALLRTIPGARSLHGALGCLAWTRLRSERYEDAYTAAREGTAVARERGSVHELAFALRSEAQTMPRGARQARLAVLRESIALLEPFEPDRHSVGSRMYLIEVLCEDEPWDDDVAALADDMLRECESADGIPRHLHALCGVYVAGCRLGFGRIDAGLDAARNALRIAVETGADAHATAALDCIAFVLAARGDADGAAQLIGYSDAFTAQGRRLELAVTRIILARARALAGLALDDSRFAARCAEGAAWSVTQAAREGARLSEGSRPAG